MIYFNIKFMKMKIKNFNHENHENLRKARKKKNLIFIIKNIKISKKISSPCSISI